ncbi:MAG: HesA/MoeB/ThiF family protein [Sporomusaceae bacterium]|nr:HesA/MoeB/ThiF family protein [Sporomusaceae bacterium]
MSRERSVELLEQGEVPERYLRNIGTIGIKGQLALLQAKVAIVGAGGLGGNIIELLTRQGVGYLRIIDGDCFAPHNLNRQLLATEGNLGINKASAAVRRVAEINSDVYAEGIEQMLDEENAEQYLAGMDIVVDALDTISSRLLVSSATKKLGIPLVHGAIAGFTGQVTTLLPGDIGLEKIYKNNAGADKGIELILGNPATTPALAATIQAQEVVKFLTGIGELLHKKLFYFDTEFNIFKILTIE